MFVELIGVGKIPICRAEREEENLIRLYSDSQFRELLPLTIFAVSTAYLYRDEDIPEWTFFAEVDVPFDCGILLDDLRVFRVKNPAVVCTFQNPFL